MSLQSIEVTSDLTPLPLDITEGLKKTTLKSDDITSKVTEGLKYNDIMSKMTEDLKEITLKSDDIASKVPEGLDETTLKITEDLKFNNPFTSIFEKKQFISKKDLENEIKNVIEIGYADEHELMKKCPNNKNIMYCETKKYIFLADEKLLKEIISLSFETIFSKGSTAVLCSKILNNRIIINNFKRFDSINSKILSVIDSVNYKSIIPQEHWNKYCFLWGSHFIKAFNTIDEANKYAEENTGLLLTLVYPEQ